MNSAAKMLEAMRRHPQDWRIEQLITVANRNGIEVRSDGGSHFVFSHAWLAATLSVPARRPIKPIYVKLFVAMCDRLVDPEP